MKPIVVRDVGPVVRRAVAADLDGIVAVVEASPTAPQWSAAEFVAMLVPEADTVLERVVVVAVMDGVVAGFAVYTLLTAVFPPDAALESLAVLPSWRRRGVAGALLHVVRGAADVAGAEVLALEVRAGNAGAISLYRGSGFKAAGIRTGYYAAPTEDAVFMQLALTR